jgi:hypothetical protein
MEIEAKKWLNENEWPDNNIDSDAFSHYTKMSSIMEQYAREYHAKKLEEARKKEVTQFKKFL